MAWPTTPSATVIGGGGLLAGDEIGEGVDKWPDLGGTGGEGSGFLVFPNGFMIGGINPLEDGEVLVLAVGVFVLHGVCLFCLVLGEMGCGAGA